jgi:hypothetical protein
LDFSVIQNLIWEEDLKSGLEEYKGKKIFVARYDHMRIEQIISEVEEVKQFMQTSPDGTAMVLVETEGTIISLEILNQFKQISLYASNHLTTKTAILGMNGPRKAFLEIVSKFTKNKVIPFDSREEALEWLVA